MSDERCAVCGWTLADRQEAGCMRGDCSQRPLPTRYYDSARPYAEYFPAKLPTEVAPTPQPPAQVDLRELRACAVILNAEAHADASAVVRAAADHIEAQAREIASMRLHQRVVSGELEAATEEAECWSSEHSKKHREVVAVEAERERLRDDLRSSRRSLADSMVAVDRLRADLAAAQSHARDYDALVDTLAAERKLRVEAEAALASAWEAEKAAVWQVENATAHLQRLIAEPNMSINLGMLCCQVERNLAAAREELVIARSIANRTGVALTAAQTALAQERERREGDAVQLAHLVEFHCCNCSDEQIQHEADARSSRAQQGGE